MFERYTEQARRVIFFARYEASQFASPFIESEHLLLGALHEARALIDSITPEQIGEIRARIEGQLTKAKGVSVSVDLPLSHESKRILAYASEEAERLNHRVIEVAHLLLGMLREEGCVAAKMLREFNIVPRIPKPADANTPEGLAARDETQAILERLLRQQPSAPGHGIRVGGGGGSWSISPQGKLGDGVQSRSHADQDGHHTESRIVKDGRKLEVQTHFRTKDDTGTYEIRVIAGKREFRQQFDFLLSELPEAD